MDSNTQTTENKSLALFIEQNPSPTCIQLQNFFY